MTNKHYYYAISLFKVLTSLIDPIHILITQHKCAYNLMRINIITCQLLFYILKIEEWSDLIGCCINEADTGTFQYSLSSSTNLVLSYIYMDYGIKSLQLHLKACIF